MNFTGGTLTLDANFTKSQGSFGWSGTTTIGGMGASTLTLTTAPLFLTGATTKTLNGPSIGYRSQAAPHAAFAAMITRMDRDIARLTDAIGGRGLGERTLILKPMTLMNESSKAVGEAVRFLKLPLDRVVVFRDGLIAEIFEYYGERAHADLLGRLGLA